MSADQAKKIAPVVVLRGEPSNLRRNLGLFVPAVIGSIAFHLVLFVALFAFVFFIGPAHAVHPGQEQAVEQVIQADEVELGKHAFNVDEDPAAVDTDTGRNLAIDRKADFTVAGRELPEGDPGIPGADPSNPPITLPPAAGFGNELGNGAANNRFDGPGINVPGLSGGVSGGMTLPGSFGGRSAATREFALRSGGNPASEAAVGRGLAWLSRQQMSDGRWMLNSPNLPEKDRGAEANDIAATALGLLPFLAAGKTHKPINKNEYDKVVDKGLKFLIRSQDPNTGYFGGSMYAHGLATIAMCEAYGLTQDPLLRRPAQAAVHLLANAQHEGGGWRYNPTRQPGDLSISGWQMMALKSAQMAGLDVSPIAIARAKSFLNNCANADEGYGYLPGSPSTPRMSAVGLLCRQYMDNWGPQHPRMIKAIQTFLKENPPDRRDVYYYYYATQVMHHFGGEEWKAWNGKMRDYLIQTQDSKNPQHANYGSWTREGDQWAKAGGRLMMTSMNLLTLEVYYRYLPLYSREAGYQMDSKK